MSIDLEYDPSAEAEHARAAARDAVARARRIVERSRTLLLNQPAAGPDQAPAEPPNPV